MKDTMRKLISAMLALLLVMAALALAEEPVDGIIAPEDESATFEAAEATPEAKAEAADPAVDEAEFDLDAIDGETAGEEPGAPVVKVIVEDSEENEEEAEDVATDETPEVEETEAEEAPEAEAFAETEGAPQADEVPEEEEAPEADEVPEEEEAPEADEVPEDEEAPEAEENPEDEEVTEAAVALPVPSELTYTGEAQALVSGEGWLYSVDGEAYSTEVPAAVDAGEYTVYFVPADDVEAEARSLAVIIAKAEVAFIPPVAAGMAD